jgi:hypothetical protein
MTDDERQKLRDWMVKVTGRLDQQQRNVEALRTELAQLRTGKGLVREADYDPERLRNALRPKETKT